MVYWRAEEQPLVGVASSALSLEDLEAQQLAEEAKKKLFGKCGGNAKDRCVGETRGGGGGCVRTRSSLVS